MGFLDESDIPFYWDLYSTFAMSDHHHCGVMGPTWPNRFYLHGATSDGKMTNSPIFSGFTSIFDALEDADIEGVQAVVEKALRGELTSDLGLAAARDVRGEPVERAHRLEHVGALRLPFRQISERIRPNA